MRSRAILQSRKCRHLAVSIYATASFLCVLALLGGAAAAQAQAPPGPDRVRVLIAFHQNPGPGEEALVQAFGGTVRYRYRLVPAIAATIPAGAIQALQNNPRIASVEPDGEVYALEHNSPSGNPELDSTWGVMHIGSGDVHAGGNLGTAVKVAVLDSGIDYTHTDLDNNYRGGYDFVNNDNDPWDDHGHGTHVAGTVAGESNGFGVVGVAPQADIYALKVLSASGSGNWSDIIAALDWVVLNLVPGGQTVITNNSYGAGSNPGGTVEAAFINSYAAGVLHVAAAGNSGNPAGKGNSVGWPARYDSVIAVAATDGNNNRASFSSTGPTVEIAAPGVAINSTIVGGGYQAWNGTSMASPHVAGTAALIVQCGITGNAAIRLRLQQTADDLGSPGQDSFFGFGLVNAEAAATSCSGTPNDPPVISITSPADNATFAFGESVSFAGTASDREDGDLTGAMVWSSSLDGEIGTGGSFSMSSLSVGTHTITAAVTDLGGRTTRVNQGLTVTPPPNTPPTASFTHSCSDLRCDFDASGSTDPGGTITNYNWNFGNGTSGAGVTISHIFPANGTYTVTLTVIDNAGASDSESKAVTVTAGPGATMHIGDLDGSSVNDGNRWTAVVTITVHGANHNPVAGATVSGTWSNGAFGSVSCPLLTDANGRCQVGMPFIPKKNPFVTFTVTNVTGAGLNYTASANHDPESDSNGTVINVPKP